MTPCAALRPTTTGSGVFSPKVYGKPDVSPSMLGGLIDHFTNLNLTGAPFDFDLQGQVYEFFLAKFSAIQGRSEGGQYTPRGIAATLAVLT